LWTPRKWGEVFEGYRKAWDLLVQAWRNNTGVEKFSIAESMIDVMFHLLPNRWIEGEVLETLTEVSQHPETDLRQVVRLISSWRGHNWRSLSRKASGTLRAIDATITGNSLRTHIIRFTLLASWDDLDMRRKTHGKYGERHQKRITELVKRALREKSILKQLLPRLSSENGFQLRLFGFSLGEHDVRFSWEKPIIDAFKAAAPSQNPELLSGYLSAVFRRDVHRWEHVVEPMIDDPLFQPHARALIVGSGLTDRLLDRICEAITKGTLTAEVVEGIGYAYNRSLISLSRIMAFLRWSITNGSSRVVQLGIDAAYLVFAFGDNRPPMPQQEVLELLTHQSAFGLEKPDHSRYEWAELAKAYLLIYPSARLQILESALSRFDELGFPSALRCPQVHNVLRELIKDDPGGAWLVIAEKIESLKSIHRRTILDWLGPSHGFGRGAVAGPLALFNPHDVVAWVAKDPIVRAPQIAAQCPATLDPAAGGSITREMLVRFGNLDGVLSALSISLRGDAWSGKASDHFREKRDKLREWLVAESSPDVIRFLEMEINSVGRQIEQFEIDEERRF
jgi:hypothetical protein